MSKHTREFFERAMQDHVPPMGAAKGHSKNYVQGAAAAKLFQPPNSTNSWKSFLEWP
jgi:hypothetical protein